MGDHTSIEWVRALAAARNAIPATWNPIDGCSRQSEGCRNCWAAGLVHTRLSKSLPGRYAGLTEVDGNGVPRFNGRVKLVDHALDRPLKAREPRVYFTGDMTDLFHTSVPSEWLDRIFVAIAAGQQHTHLLLTKRPAVMRAYLADPDTPRRIDDLLDHRGARGIEAFGGWPLPNVWIGATVADQADADANIPELLAAPAAKRFLSMEPLLGPVDMRRWLPGKRAAVGLDGRPFLAPHWYMTRCEHCGWVGSSELCGSDQDDDIFCGGCHRSICGNDAPCIDWVITGGEAARHARPSHPDWFRAIREQCVVSATPFLFKQWGDWVPQVGAVDGWNLGDNPEISRFDHRDWKGDRWGEPYRPMWCDEIEDDTVSRVGKKAAGRLLDGRIWDEVPDLTAGA